MPVTLNDSELLLYGTVGEMFWEDSFTARAVVSALAQVKGKDISVRLNSGGGIADEGVAIYNSLKNHKGKVTVYVDGMAASAASLIAMAGDKVVMRTGSVMMIHDPMMIAIGNAADMEKSKQALDAIGDSMADVYAEKTGRKVTEIRAEMREELWLTPADAKAKGFADEEEDGEPIEASAFDYRVYSRAPERIVALSDTRAWSNRLRDKPKATIERTQPMAGDMTKEAAAALADEASKKSAEEATSAEATRAGEIATACATAGVPAMAAVLIREGVTVEAAKARIEGAKAIREKVALARKTCPQIDEKLADQYIAAGASVEKVAADLFDKMAAVQAETQTRSHHTGDDGKTLAAKVPNATSIYASRGKARAERASGLVN